MSRRTRPLLALIGAGAALAFAAAGMQPGAAAPGKAPKGPPAKPTKVVIIVVDSLSKEIVDKYAMTNIQDLMADYVDTPKSYLGHTGSVTVVSHNVITSGQLPKHMGWTSEGYRDVDNVLTPEAGNTSGLYITSDMSTDLTTLQQHAGYMKLDAYLDAAAPGSKQFTISPKTYAAYAFGSSASDSIIRFSGGTCGIPDPENPTTWRRPGGVNVPSYLSMPNDCTNRFWVHDGYDLYNYDTDKLPALMYPLDGDRYVTGHDPLHEGGDVWAADVALKIMDKEPTWNGIFVTLPGVDKAAHMWGGVHDPGPTGDDGDPMTHMAQATATADAQVGKIMDALVAHEELDNTLVVITADHGSVAGVHFYGDEIASKNRGYYNWYYGNAANDPDDYFLPQEALDPLIATGKIGLSYTDSMLSEWLNDQSPAAVAQVAGVMEDLPGVTGVYRRDGDHYTLVSPIRWDLMTTKAERQWYAKYAQELVDTQAAAYGPDLVATLPDDTTYSVKGDHGGIQRATQQIPIVFAGAGLSSKDVKAPVRSVDIMPTILKAMGIAPIGTMDGVGYPLPRAK